MKKESAGLLLWRDADGTREVLLIHPGGPFWAKKDEGAWSIPKGEIAEGEDPLDAAKRETREETGFAPEGNFISLGSIEQKGGKTVRAWAAEYDADLSAFRSNTFEMEWPPHSGNKREFPEADRAEYMSFAEARIRMNPAQAQFLDTLEGILSNCGK